VSIDCRALAPLYDFAAVAIFVVLGRISHDEGISVGGLAKTGSPFLIGLMAGWIATPIRMAPREMRSGLTVLTSTVVVGMAIRKLAFDDGIAPSFVIVTIAFLAIFMLGWRYLDRASTRI
jgi:hypothetical protein